MISQPKLKIQFDFLQIQIHKHVHNTLQTNKNTHTHNHCQFSCTTQNAQSFLFPILPLYSLSVYLCAMFYRFLSIFVTLMLILLLPDFQDVLHLRNFPVSSFVFCSLFQFVFFCLYVCLWVFVFHSVSICVRFHYFFPCIKS